MKVWLGYFCLSFFVTWILAAIFKDETKNYSAASITILCVMVGVLVATAVWGILY